MKSRVSGGLAGVLRRGLQNALLCAGGLLVSLVLMELGLRAGGATFPQFYRPDVHCGVAYREGMEGWNLEESKTYIRISKAGLRDMEHEQIKPPNTLRIAVLGDSYAAAFQVPLEQTFWSIMGRELELSLRGKHTRVEVVNFGVGGYGTAQELLTLHHRVWAYSPDVILLAFVTGNDVRNNSLALNIESRIPYFRYRGGRLVLDEGYLRWYRSRKGWLARAYYRVLDHSYCLRALKTGRYTLGRMWRSLERKNLAIHAGLGELGLDQNIYREPLDPLWKEAWAVTEEILGMMNREVRGRGRLFFVVTLTNGDQVHPDRAARDDLARRLGVPDLYYPDSRIKALGDREGFPVLNLAKPLQEYVDRTGAYLHGFGDRRGTGHWNAEGHRLAGRMIGRALAQEFPDLGLAWGRSSPVTPSTVTGAAPAPSPLR